VLPFFVNEHLRYTYRATVSHYIAKVSPPRVVLIGDSIAAGARDWQVTLGAQRFSVINLGSNGATTYQAAGMVDKALAYRPSTLIAIAGVNDFCDPRFDEVAYLRDVATLSNALSKARDAPGIQRVVFIVPPPTRSEACNQVRDSVRVQLVDHMARSGLTVLDIAPCVTDRGLLADRYTTDGVHLSHPAYDLIDYELRAMEGGVSDHECAETIKPPNATMRTGMGWVSSAG
jgi:lysophospholipase L1-like esterase